MNRVAIIGGARTPFVKAAGAFSQYSALELGSHVVKSAVKNLFLNPTDIEELVFSSVLLDPRLPNLAREIILRNDLPATISAHFVSNNCISGLVAINMLADAIRLGRVKMGLAGGVESMSRPALGWKPEAEDFFLKLSRAKGLGDSLKQLIKYRPGFAFPLPPSPKEPTTGLTMGEHCEIMAKDFHISREEQDKIAMRSHVNAARAQAEGFLAQEIAPFADISQDNLIRKDTSLEKLAKLKPVFDRSATGTITAGNASALTDGASIVCLMSEAEAQRQGREILGFVEQVEFSAISPRDGLLMAPATAVPKLLKRAGLGVADIDFWEIHEAFGAQVAANLKIWNSGWQRYNTEPLGEISAERININGGSIALGHPFAATGGRILLSLANQLKRSGKDTAVISVCAAGGMAGACVVRRN